MASPRATQTPESQDIIDLRTFVQTADEKKFQGLCTTFVPQLTTAQLYNIVNRPGDHGITLAHNVFHLSLDSIQIFLQTLLQKFNSEQMLEMLYLSNENGQTVIDALFKTHGIEGLCELINILEKEYSRENIESLFEKMKFEDKKAIYHAALELRVPLNSDKTKFIMAHLTNDLEQQMALLESENSQQQSALKVAIIHKNFWQVQLVCAFMTGNEKNETRLINLLLSCLPFIADDNTEHSYLTDSEFDVFCHVLERSLKKESLLILLNDMLGAVGRNLFQSTLLYSSAAKRSTFLKLLNVLFKNGKLTAVEIFDLIISSKDSSNDKSVLLDTFHIQLASTICAEPLYQLLTDVFSADQVYTFFMKGDVYGNTIFHNIDRTLKTKDSIEPLFKLLTIFSADQCHSLLIKTNNAGKTFIQKIGLNRGLIAYLFLKYTNLSIAQLGPIADIIIPVQNFVTNCFTGYEIGQAIKDEETSLGRYLREFGDVLLGYHNKSEFLYKTTFADACRQLLLKLGSPLTEAQANLFARVPNALTRVLTSRAILLDNVLGFVKNLNTVTLFNSLNKSTETSLRKLTKNNPYSSILEYLILSNYNGQRGYFIEFFKNLARLSSTQWESLLQVQDGNKKHLLRLVYQTLIRSSEDVSSTKTWFARQILYPILTNASLNDETIALFVEFRHNLLKEILSIPKHQERMNVLWLCLQQNNSTFGKIFNRNNFEIDPRIPSIYHGDLETIFAEYKTWTAGEVPSYTDLYKGVMDAHMLPSGTPQEITVKRARLVSILKLVNKCATDETNKSFLKKLYHGDMNSLEEYERDGFALFDRLAATKGSTSVEKIKKKAKAAKTVIVGGFSILKLAILSKVTNDESSMEQSGASASAASTTTASPLDKVKKQAKRAQTAILGTVASVMMKLSSNDAASNSGESSAASSAFDGQSAEPSSTKQRLVNTAKEAGTAIITGVRSLRNRLFTKSAASSVDAGAAVAAQASSSAASGDGMSSQYQSARSGYSSSEDESGADGETFSSSSSSVELASAESKSRRDSSPGQQ